MRDWVQPRLSREVAELGKPRLPEFVRRKFIRYYPTLDIEVFVSNRPEVGHTGGEEHTALGYRLVLSQDGV